VVAVTVVLTVNPGSSSLRLHVVQADTESILAASTSEEKPDHDSASKALDEVLSQVDSVDAVGHRLVHGGPHLWSPTVVTDETIAQAEAAASLAPAHVPVTLDLLGIVRERLPDVPHVLCPDTAFHAGLSEVAMTYAIPAEWRERFGIRRYGFHGLSYAWATTQAAELLDRPVAEVNLLLAHLGGGCSVCAVRDGSSVDTSMGFTPLEGVPMSTRSGSVDPGMLLWLLDGRLTLDELSEGLYHQSGLLGLSGGYSGDTRDLVRASAQGCHEAQRALDVFTRRVSQALAGMAVNLPRVDALVFTGEIGWDQPEVRAAISQDMDRVLAGRDISVLVIEPREELQLARNTARAIG
jgi:acetate kinase